MRSSSIDIPIFEAGSSSSDDDIDLGADRRSMAVPTSVYSSYDELVYTWSAHELFRMFLHDDFNADDFFAGLPQQSLKKILENLHSASKTIDQYISSSVSENLDDLLKQTMRVDGVEHDAQSLLSDCSLLKSAYDSMYDSVMNPVDKIKTLVRSAEEAQERAELLRNILRFVQLCNKARQSISTSLELSRVATILCEISNVVLANELHHVASLRDDYDWVQQQVFAVRSQAEVLLKAAMLQNNQVQISSALQIAYNLSTLSSVVDDVTKEVHMDFTDGISQLCDNAKLFSPQASKAKDSENVLSSSPAVRTVVWHRVESIFDILFDTVTCVHALYSVLNKKSDPVTRQTYAEIIGRDLSVLIDIALGYFEFVKTKLLSLAGFTKTVSNILTEEFPRLYDVCESCWQRGLARLLPSDARIHMLKTIETFQGRYLTDRVEKIQAPIAMMFPNGINLASASVPTINDMSILVNCVLDAVSALESRTELQRFILKGVSGPLNLCVSKIEALIGNEASTSPLLWSATRFERFNAILSIAAYLFQHISALTYGTHARCRMLSREISEPLLRSVRQNAESIGTQILEPVFVLTVKNLECALESETSIVAVLQPELERNKTSLLRLSSRANYLRIYMRPFIQKIETTIMYRLVAMLSSGFIRESRIQQVCDQLKIVEETLKNYYTVFPDPRKKSDLVHSVKLIKISLFRNWINSGQWRHPTEEEIAAIPKIIFVCCSVGMAQSLVPVCDLICMTPIKLYKWMISHSEPEAMRLCQDQVIVNMVADSDLSRNVLQFITDLVHNKT